MLLLMEYIGTGLVVTTIVFLLFSILCRLITGIYMNRLIRETENLAVTGNRFLVQCKTRFRNSFRLNDGIPNIPVYVDRLLEKIRIGRFTVDGLYHLSGQMMLLSVASAGLGACSAIAGGRSAAEILPFYLLCFLCLYTFFSVSGLVNLEGKRERLKVNLTDYLENHMAPRLAALEKTERSENERIGNETGETKEIITGAKRSGKKNPQSAAEIYTADQIFNGTQEKELEELLKEFFA